MTFRNKLQYLIVKKLKISNKIAIKLIENGEIKINGKICINNIIIEETDEVKYQDEIIQTAKKYIYIAFYKPRGIETTLNEKIKDNLKEIIPFENEVFPIGRLDKESEGLLILTNNGKIFDKTLRKENEVEKEYLVVVDKEITNEFLEKMRSGIEILKKKTLPCFIEKTNTFEFRIVLKQGMNRQIRRMCYKIGYEVSTLIRTRIGSIQLETLKPLEYRSVDYFIN